jgi:hypothetical protein
MTALGLVTGALLALGLLGRELDRALTSRPDTAPLRPPIDVLWALGVMFAFLVVVRILDYL